MDRMMQKFVPNRCFVYIPGFRVVYFEGLISAMLPGMIEKVAMKRKYVVHQAQRKLLHIPPVFLSPLKFFPCFEQIFNGNYLVRCIWQMRFHF